MKGQKIVVPHMIKCIHEGHLGILKCRQRVRDVIYWPWMNYYIAEMVNMCPKVKEGQTQAQEPLWPHHVIEYPFEKNGVEICQYEYESWLIICDSSCVQI